MNCPYIRLEFSVILPRKDSLGMTEVRQMHPWHGFTTWA